MHVFIRLVVSSYKLSPCSLRQPLVYPYHKVNKIKYNIRMKYDLHGMRNVIGAYYYILYAYVHIYV